MRSPESTELRENEIRLKEARKNASSAIGILIAIGHRIASPDMQQHLSNITLPFVIGKIPHVHFRVQKSYALLLLVSQLVGYSIDIQGCYITYFNLLALRASSSQCDNLPGYHGFL